MMYKIRFRRRFLALALTVLLVILTACQSSAPAAPADSAAPAGSAESAEPAAPTDSAAPDVTVRFAWWGGEDRAAKTMAMANRFMELNPNYTIECEPGTWDNFWQKLAVQISSNDQPDICQTDWKFNGEILRLGKPFANIEELTDIIDLSQIVEVDQVYKGEAGYSFGVPIAVNAHGTYANTEFLEKWGMDPERYDYSYEDLKEIAATIRAQDPETYMIYYAFDQVLYQLYDYLKGKSRKNMFNDADLTLNVTAEEFTDYYTFVKDLFDTGVYAPIELFATYTTSMAEQVPGWQNGKIGLTGGLNSNLTTLLPGSPFEVKTLRYMYSEGASDLSNAPVPGSLISISAATPYLNECAVFVNWFLNDDEAIDLHEICRGLPSNKIAAQRMLDKGLIDQQTLDTIKYAEEFHGTAAGTTEFNPEIQKSLYDTVCEVAYGRLTPEEAGAKTVADLTQIAQNIA